MPQSRQVIVAVAHPDEAAQLPPEAEIIVTGVGMVAASARLMEFIQETQPGELRNRWVILNMGTAGAVRKNVSGTIVPGKIINRDVDEAAASAVGLPPSVITLSEAGMTLGTGDSFVMNPDLAHVLAYRCDLVDMEAYAMAWVCDLMGIPFRCVKHISDTADEDAANWDENVHTSAHALGNWYRRNCPDHRLLV